MKERRHSLAWHDEFHPMISKELSQAASKAQAVISEVRMRTDKAAVEDCNGAKECTSLK